MMKFLNQGKTMTGYTDEQVKASLDEMPESRLIAFAQDDYTVTQSSRDEDEGAFLALRWAASKYLEAKAVIECAEAWRRSRSANPIVWNDLAKAESDLLKSVEKLNQNKGDR